MVTGSPRGCGDLNRRNGPKSVSGKNLKEFILTTSTSNAVRFQTEYPSHIMPINIIGNLVQRIAPFPVYVVNTSHLNRSGNTVDLGGVTKYFDREDDAVIFAYRKAKGKQRNYLRNCRGLRAVEFLVSDIAVYAESRYITLDKSIRS